MVRRIEHKGSEPTLEVVSVGVVDEHGRYVEHDAFAPRKARSTSQQLRSVVICDEHVGEKPTTPEALDVSATSNSSSATSESQNLAGTDMLLKSEEQVHTAVTRASRGRWGRVVLRALGLLEAHLFIVVFVVLIALAMVAIWVI